MATYTGPVLADVVVPGAGSALRIAQSLGASGTMMGFPLRMTSPEIPFSAGNLTSFIIASAAELSMAADLK